MSKLDAVRALREARFEQERSRARQPTARPKTVAVAPPVEREAEPAAEPDASLCGHRNMSGRTCTREKGHAAKTHRYS